MSQSINKALANLRYANFIVILGSGITWTGLSYDLATQFHEPRFMAFMQILSVISSFFGPFVALWLLTQTRMRTIIVGSELIATACCAFIFSILAFQTAPDLFNITIIGSSIFLILLSGSISGLFIEPLYASLIEHRDNSDKEVRREFAVFACLGILSKLLGMSLGPFMFAFLGNESLLLNGLSFFISFILLRIAMNKIPSDIKLNAIRPDQVTIFRKSTWAEIVQLPLIESAIANSLIFVVVLSTSTQIMVLDASPTQLSLFWFGATGCAFLSHFFLSKFTRTSEWLFDFEKKFGFLQVIPIGVSLLSNNIYLLLVSQWIFSLLNPLTTNQSRADFYHAFGRDTDKALDAYAMRNILTNLIILVFSLLISFANSAFFNQLLALTLCALVIVRWLIALRICEYVKASSTV